jgi:hypothetical protein
MRRIEKRSAQLFSGGDSAFFSSAAGAAAAAALAAAERVGRGVSDAELKRGVPLGLGGRVDGGGLEALVADEGGAVRRVGKIDVGGGGDLACAEDLDVQGFLARGRGGGGRLRLHLLGGRRRGRLLLGVGGSRRVDLVALLGGGADAGGGEEAEAEVVGLDLVGRAELGTRRW